MRILGRSKLIYSLVLGLLLGLGVGTISVLGTETGWLPGLVVLVGYLYLALRRPIRRWRATRRSLTRDAGLWLKRSVRLYARLGSDARARFDTDVQIILDEWIFEGVGEVQVTDEMRLGVAAGVALLLHGHPEWELPYRQTVLFYPDSFDNDYLTDGDGNFDGMAHQQGPVILTTHSLEESWLYPEDGRNVVLHELAHLLDFETAFADGVPALVDARSADAWEALVEKEMDRILRRQSILDSYGGTARTEFFAVAVETFFERPAVMERYHAELFEAMRAMFRLDPRTGVVG